jgi:hypothetical protein
MACRAYRRGNMVMKNFTVRDIKGLFSDWNFDGYAIDGKELTSRDDQALILADMEELRPVTIYQDGTVNGLDDGHSVDIVTDAQGFTDNEFDALWRLYGYTDNAIDE